MNKVINFGKYETLSVLANVFIIKIFLGLPSELSKNAGSAGWIVSIISGGIFLFILYLIFKLYDADGRNDIYDLTENIGGKPLLYIFSLILLISFLVKGALLIRVSVDVIRAVLPFDISPFLCYFLFFIGSVFCAFKGLEGVVRLHAVFLPIILLAFVFAVSICFLNPDITNLFPILGFGAKNVVVSGLKYSGIYSDLIYVFLLCPYVKDKKVYKKACFGGVILSAIVITLVLFSYSLAVPYPQSTKLFMPVYQISRFVKIASNSQGFEAFILPEWIISSLLYISLSIYFSYETLNRVIKPKYDKIFAIPVAIVIFLLALLPESFEKATQIGIKIVNPYVLIVSGLAVLIAVIYKIRRKYG